jgi:hypothetical protein
MTAAGSLEAEQPIGCAIRNGGGTQAGHPGRRLRRWEADGSALRAARIVALTQAARVARPRWWPAGLAWALWALAMLGIAAVTWLDLLLRQAGRADLVLWTADAAGEVLAMVSAATVGAVLAGRRPRHPVGWLLLGLALSVVAAAVATGYAGYGLLARPGSLPVADWVAVYDEHAGFPMAACLGFILLLTPTGALPSPRWRWWAWAMAAATLVAMVTWAPQPFEVYRSVANPLATPAADRLLGVANVALAVSIMAIPMGAWSLVVRFHRARGVERQQLRWLALAAALVAAGAVVITVLLVVGAEAPVGWVFGICLALLPLATAAAILRYRLYDLDRIISRTLAYTILTVLLGLGYAAVILGLGRLLSRSSSLVVAAATLAVAALFQPARRRIQSLVDRRFNRRRYDAARTIEAFSARLRDEVDLDTLSGELLTVVDQTMQPTRASLWLRPQSLSTVSVGPAVAGHPRWNDQQNDHGWQRVT